jgi:bile acid:Na+ symporter, BASS family
MEQELLTLVGWLVALAVPLASFVTGLQAPGHVRTRWLRRRPALFLRSLLVILAVSPLLAVLLLSLVELPEVIEAGILAAVLSVGIGPPAAARHFGGSDTGISYEVALNVCLLVLSIGFIPGVLALHGQIFHHGVRLDAAAVAHLVASRALLPMFAGLAVSFLFPSGTRIVPRLEVIVNGAIFVILSFALVVAGPRMLELPGEAWLVCGLLVLLSLGAGHLFGGREEETRRILAVFTAMRCPALALLIGAQTQHAKELIPVIAMYVLVSLATVALWAVVRGLRLHGREAHNT